MFLRDEKVAADIVQEQLEKLQHKVVELDYRQISAELLDEVFDMIVIDVVTTNGAMLKSLKTVRGIARFAQTPIVALTKEADSDMIIEVMKLGAFDHMSKPVESAELESLIRRAVGRPKPQDAVLETDSLRLLLGSSSAMRGVEKLIGMAAGSEATVLITGETGTGKDTVARAIHEHSAHQNHTLTVIDCTAVPEDYGSFQSLAEGSQGTIILDEIGDLNPQMQAMLVRALKEIQIRPGTTSGVDSNPRVVATTQYNLISMVREKLFREDLFYRLNVIPIKLPPLRERGSDILVLAESFLQQANPGATKRLSSTAAKILLDHEWPGNVRELQNLMYHLNVVVRAAVIEASDLSILRNDKTDDVAAIDELDYYSAVATLEKRLLIRALKEADGSRTDAAKLLGINRQLLYSKMKAHGLEELT